MNAKTADRSLEVLARIRALATSANAANAANANAAAPSDVVFLGDFWHFRNVLSVRQLASVLHELEAWRAAGIGAVLLPGNHDQVTLDGGIHGLLPFAADTPVGTSSLQVVTEPSLDLWRGRAYLPWREDPAEQAALFADLPDLDAAREAWAARAVACEDNSVDGASIDLPVAPRETPPQWTTFGHAEVRGARINRYFAPSHDPADADDAGRAAGRVTTAAIAARSVRTFLGHYHQRQRVDPMGGPGGVYYIGSPFEQNFGEMGDPKGVRPWFRFYFLVA